MDAPGSPAKPPTSSRGTNGVVALLAGNRDFRLLFAAMLISFGGDWFLFVALAGLLFDLTASPSLVAALTAAMTVPFALASFVGGPLADRLDRKVLMVASDLLRASLVAGFFLVDRPSEVWLVFALVASISALNAGFTPAAMASVPNLVDRADLASANVLGAAAWGTMLTVGASLGGVVVSVFGREAGYLADAASFLVSAALVLAIRRPFSEQRPGREHPGLGEATRETLRYARRDSRVLALLSVKGGFGIGAGVIALLPLLALDAFAAGDRGTGILYGFRGVGIVLGPFLVRPFVKDDDLRPVFWAISAAFVIFGLSYAVVPWMPGVYLAGLFVLVGHLGGGMQWTMSSYALQVIVPDRIRGRIFAFDEALVSVTVAVSATMAGLAAEVFDVRLVLFGLALVACGFAVVWTAATTNVRRGLRPERDRAAAAPPRGGAYGP